jgi:hypothetical protein
MEKYTELYRLKDFVITESIGENDQPVYHIRNRDGEIVSREYHSPNEPVELMEYIRVRT